MIFTPKAQGPGQPPACLSLSPSSVPVRCGHAALAAEPESIAWRDDYDNLALEEARAANRLLWIQFTGPWCPNCTRMERDSFPDPVVVQARANSRSCPSSCAPMSTNSCGSVLTFPLSPRRSSSPRPARSSPFIKATWGPRSSTPFSAIRSPRVPGKPSSRAASRDLAPVAGSCSSREGARLKAAELIALDGYCAVSLVRDREADRRSAASTRCDTKG